MVGSMNTEALAKYLEKQREVRLLSEELESLKTDTAIEQSLKIRHELEAMMGDYDLTPEQLVEVLCVFFGVGKPKALTGAPGDQVGSSAGSKASASASREEQMPKDAESVNESQGRPTIVRSLPANRGKKVADGSVPATKATIRRKSSGPGSGSASPEAGDSNEGGKGEVAVDDSQVKGAAKKKAVPKKAPQSKGGAPKKAEPHGRRSGRPARLYVNPHTGQKVRTRGANHRILNAWRAEYGRDVVETWWTPDE